MSALTVADRSTVAQSKAWSLQHGFSLDQVIANHTKKDCRQPSWVLSIDAGVGFLSRTGPFRTTSKGSLSR